MSDERVYLTVEQALAMLPEGEYVHTFRGGGGLMSGASGMTGQRCSWLPKRLRNGRPSP